MRALSLFLLLIAGCGFVLSLTAHVMALAGMKLPGLVWILHVGVFVVWIPAIAFSNRNFKTRQRKAEWQKMLQLCPVWMGRMSKAIFAYAIVNFILFIMTTIGQPKPTGAAPASVIRGFSGHWMIFYWAAFVTLYANLKGTHLARKTGLSGRVEERKDHLSQPQHRSRDE